jgi:hypothetical protein
VSPRSTPRQTYREGSDLEAAERVLTRDGSMSEVLYWQFVEQYLSALLSSSSS